MFFNSFRAPDKAAAKAKTGFVCGNGGEEVSAEID
jgi:hypothetical protein